MASQSILLGDDEEAIRRVLRAQLTARGYSIYEATTGDAVLQAVPATHPDAILLDLGLPDMDGIEVIRHLRGMVQTPIIVLSVRAAPSDKIAALDAGADDYLTKPCQPSDLLERIRAALFRAKAEDTFVFRAGDLLVDLKQRVVKSGGRPVELTDNEFDVLRVLALNAGRLVTQGQLAREAWGTTPDEEPRQLLRTTVATLRSKVETDPMRPRHIATEPGVGYRLRIEA